MLLLTRTKTLTAAEHRKKSKSVKRCSSCKRTSSSVRRSKTPEPKSIKEKNSMIQPNSHSNHPTAPPQSIRKPDDLGGLNFPEPPTSFVGGNKPGNGGGNGGNDGGGGDLDFDDLAKRFDALKKRNN